MARLTKLSIMVVMIPIIVGAAFHSWHDAAFVVLGIIVGAVARSVWPRGSVGVDVPLTSRRDDT